MRTYNCIYGNKLYVIHTIGNWKDLTILNSILNFKLLFLNKTKSPSPYSPDIVTIITEHSTVLEMWII